MKVQREFSKHAALYGERNVIQREVAKKLIAVNKTQPRKILDLGCGSGTLFSYIDWPLDRFVGIDFSSQMLSLHPQGENVELILGDFNDPELFRSLQHETFDRIYSASALQWASDLSSVFEAFARLKAPVSLALFTSGTFKTLHQSARISPLLRSADEIIEIANTYFNASYEIAQHSLSFDSVREMFRYIKRSGVSGGEKKLNVAQMKQLMKSYPLDYLEFEILFIISE